MLYINDASPVVRRGGFFMRGYLPAAVVSALQASGLLFRIQSLSATLALSISAAASSMITNSKPPNTLISAMNFLRDVIISIDYP